jgi:DNA-binding CsgD family transcriptional regulator
MRSQPDRAWARAAQLITVERVACRLRIAIGLLLLAMTLLFDPAQPWIAGAAVAVALGWSCAILAVLRMQQLSAGEVMRLAAVSLWLDVSLAVVGYLVFLPDPASIPVALLLLMVFRLAARYGRRGAVVGLTLFGLLFASRVSLNLFGITDGEVRPALVLAWALAAVLVVVLAAETRAQTSERRDHDDEMRLPPAGTPGIVSAAGSSQISGLAERLSFTLETSGAGASLTRREQEVLLLLGTGLSCTEIARRLHVTASTVRNHVHNMREKFGFETRDELIELARQVVDRKSGQTGATP